MDKITLSKLICPECLSDQIEVLDGAALNFRCMICGEEGIAVDFDPIEWDVDAKYQRREQIEGWVEANLYELQTVHIGGRGDVQMALPDYRYCRPNAPRFERVGVGDWWKNVGPKEVS